MNEFGAPVRRAGFASTVGVAYFFLAGLRAGRFTAAVALRPVGFLAGFLPAAFFRAAGFVEGNFAILPGLFLGLADAFFAVGIGLTAAGEGPDAIGVVTFTTPFLPRTTDAATAIRRAYFFFIAILVDM